MKQVRLYALDVLVFVGALFLASCGGGGGDSPAPGVTVSLSPSTATVTASFTRQFTATVANSSNTAVTWSIQEGAAGGSVSTAGLYTAPNTPGTYHVTATSQADPNAKATATATVVAAPAITSFTSANDTVPRGTSTTLTGTFSGGSGSVNQGVGAVTSGVGKSSGNLATTTTFTLTVTNAAMDSVTAQATVTVVPAPPVISSFTASPSTITLGNSSTLAWTVSGQDTLSIDNGVGNVTGQTSKLVSPTSATTYTLTATNSDGSTTAQTTVTVVFAPQISSFTASPTTVTPGSVSTLTPVFTQGTGVIDQGIGAVTTGNDYSTGSLSMASTFTLRVTNSAGDSVTATRTINVDSGTFSPAGGTMSVARSAHTSELLANGNVLVAGGQGNSTQFNSAEEFDPNANSGTGGFTVTAAPMGSVRAYPKSVLLPNGKVLVIGGIQNAQNAICHNTAELYDPQTRTFTPSADTMSDPRIVSSATLLLNGKVLIAGGSNCTTALGSAELYDPATDTFTPTAGTLGTPRGGHWATLLPNGKVLIVGGSASVELYDPETNAFAPAGTIQTGTTSTLLQNGQVLLTGGGNPAVSAELYNPASGQVTSTGSANLARYSAPTATLLADGRILVAGNAGAPGQEVAADGEIYSPGTGLFTFTGNLGNRGQQTAHLLTSGKVVLIGGYSYGAASSLLNTATLFNAGPAVPAPQPASTVTAPGSVSTGTTGHITSVPATSSARYFWMIRGGTITAGLGTNSVTFTSGAAGTLILDCLVVSNAGIPAHGTASVTVNP